MAALSDNPVVLLHGARQVGKSTVIKQIIENKDYSASFITLDNATYLAAAQANPDGFLDSYSNVNLAIDEVQRVPELFLALKASVDNKRTPGKYLLTGSSNVFLLPKVSESLAGRIEILTLFPFSQTELAGNDFNFVDHFFKSRISLPSIKGIKRDELINKVIAGGYPESVTRKDKSRRVAWFNSYITTILQRDVRDISNIESLTDLPKILSLIAVRAGNLMNYAELSRSTRVSQSTLKRYMTLLNATFLIYLLMPWTKNLGKRLIKTPKAYLCDTGLLSALAGNDEKKLNEDANLFGHYLENFVLLELVKLISFSSEIYQIYYLRTASGGEVDFIIEKSNGDIMAVEVKSGSLVDKKSFKNIEMLRDALGKKFLRGIMLYTGSAVVPFDKQLIALPINTLWEVE